MLLLLSSRKRSRRRSRRRSRLALELQLQQLELREHAVGSCRRLLLRLQLLAGFQTGEAEHRHRRRVRDGRRRHVHSTAVIHAVQTSHFVSKVNAHQLHSAENHDQRAAVDHRPRDADDAADYLLSDDVAAAVGDSAVPAQSVTQKQWRMGATYTSPPPSCSSGRLDVWGVGCGEKR